MVDLYTEFSTLTALAQGGRVGGMSAQSSGLFTVNEQAVGGGGRTMTTAHEQDTTGWGIDSSLDLFSTSQTFSEKCVNNAPFICIPPTGRDGLLMQACCNDWTCPRCGQMRARHEYGRIVEGCRTLSEQGLQLYFITITCRGDVSPEQAEKGYLRATNKLHAAFQAHVKKTGQKWAYFAVTERQQRGHPHSHYVMACKPNDAYVVSEFYERYLVEVEQLNGWLTETGQGMNFAPGEVGEFGFMDMFSLWLSKQCVKVGLGVQCRVSFVEQSEAVSRYVAKYLFKDSALTRWPKGWKRVRYSQSWPKMKVSEGATGAYPVLTRDDWKRVASETGTIVAKDGDVYERALLHLCTNVICKQPNHIDL